MVNKKKLFVTLASHDGGLCRVSAVDALSFTYSGEFQAIVISIIWALLMVKELGGGKAHRARFFLSSFLSQRVPKWAIVEET